MEKNYLAFIYKRETINEVDLINKAQGKWINYILTPLEIVEGKIQKENGTKVFYTKDGKYSLRSIENLDGLNDEFVYAFPYDVTKNDVNAKKEIRDFFAKDILYNIRLLQSHEVVNKKEVLKTYANNVSNDKVYGIINPDSYDESEKVVEYDVNEYIKKIAPDVDALVLKYSDILKFEKEKEYQKEKEKKENELYVSTPHKAVKYNKKLIYADEIYDEITKYVMSQDEQVKTIATIFAKNQRINNPYLKNNFILCGPTGVGKSEIFRRLSSIANVPMINEDSSEFTAEGYVGKSLTSILSHLYDAAGGDLKAAENGIIMMDEIDKKAGGRGNGNLEVGKAAVIDALLKMIEGHTYEIKTGLGKVYFDTSRVTFAFCGAFSGIEKFADNILETERRKIGFHSSGDQNQETISPQKLYTFESLRKYGLLPEFLGRNRIIAMNSLTQEDLEKILKESELSYLKLYSDYLKKEMNLTLTYDDKVIKAMAALALKLKSGARSLKAIGENTFSEIDYLVGSSLSNNYKEIIITEDTVEDPKKFILK